MEQREVTRKANGAEPAAPPRKRGIFGQALRSGGPAEALTREAARIKAAVTDAIFDAVEEAQRDARRALRRGYNAAEDLAEGGSYRIRRAPLRSVAIAFGAGALGGIGLLLALRKRSAPTEE